MRIPRPYTGGDEPTRSAHFNLFLPPRTQLSGDPPCRTCSVAGSTLPLTVHDVQAMQTDKVYPCFLCKESFNRPVKLTQHYESKHKNVPKDRISKMVGMVVTAVCASRFYEDMKKTADIDDILKAYSPTSADSDGQPGIDASPATLNFETDSGNASETQPDDDGRPGAPNARRLPKTHARQASTELTPLNDDLTARGTKRVCPDRAYPPLDVSSQTVSSHSSPTLATTAGGAAAAKTADKDLTVMKNKDTVGKL